MTCASGHHEAEAVGGRSLILDGRYVKGCYRQVTEEVRPVQAIAKHTIRYKILTSPAPMKDGDAIY
jgi:hypothetical protein